jgi:hypothetical protein
MYPISTYGSTAIETMTVNPFTGSVKVRFVNTPDIQYRFLTSRRAILSLMIKDTDSLGQWVNCHL